MQFLNEKIESTTDCTITRKRGVDLEQVRTQALDFFVDIDPRRGEDQFLFQTGLVRRFGTLGEASGKALRQPFAQRWRQPGAVINHRRQRLTALLQHSGQTRTLSSTDCDKPVNGAIEQFQRRLGHRSGIHRDRCHHAGQAKDSHRIDRRRMLAGTDTHSLQDVDPMIDSRPVDLPCGLRVTCMAQGDFDLATRDATSKPLAHCRFDRPERVR